MCIDMDEEIENLRLAFDRYYATDYSDKEDTLENFNLRKRAVEILALKLRTKDEIAADQILKLISENTGCAEDLSIFENLIKPIHESGQITQEQIDVVLNAKATARWK